MKTKTSPEEAKYPYYDLKACIAIGEAVKTVGGRSGQVSKSQLARQLSVSEKASSFALRAASTKTYGILKGWGSLTLTDEAVKYFYPADAGQKTKAELYFLSRPRSFDFLLTRYNGSNLPDTSTIANVLLQENMVQESWALKVAQIFMRSVRECGLIDASGHLRYKAALDGSAAGSGKEIQPLTDPKQPNPSQDALPLTAPRPPAIGTEIHSFMGIELHVPEELTEKQWTRLHDLVDTLNPKKKGGGS